MQDFTMNLIAFTIETACLFDIAESVEVKAGRNKP